LTLWQRFIWLLRLLTGVRRIGRCSFIVIIGVISLCLLRIAIFRLILRVFVLFCLGNRFYDSAWWVWLKSFAAFAALWLTLTLA
jgi:hypothetical protein